MSSSWVAGAGASAATWGGVMSSAVPWIAPVADPTIRFATAEAIPPTADDQNFQLQVRGVRHGYLLAERYHLLEAELPQRAP